MSEASEPKRGGKPQPLKRAAALYMEILALRSKLMNNLPALRVALAALPDYVSRGKGGKRPKHMARSILGRWTEDRSKYQPHQGKSECARRVFQALPASERAFIRSIEGDVMKGGDIE